MRNFALAGALAIAAFAIPTDVVAQARPQLTIGVSQFPPNLHPSIDPTVAKSYLLAAARRGLTYYDQEWKIVCGLCTEVPGFTNGRAKLVDLADGKKGITAAFTLKPGLKWADGVPITAKDVAFSLEAGKRPDLGFNNPDLYAAMEKVEITDETERRATWYAEVCERTARLIVHWMRVGFVHGVMNTDNMSILGLTIDYGPYGWIDNFDPHWTPNTTDAQGRRYRFGQQPAIAQWNLVRLADAIAPLFADESALQAGIDRFSTVYIADYEAMNAAKFGFTQRGEREQTIIREAFRLLYDAEMDYSMFFRALGELPDDLPAESASALLGDVFYDDSKRDAQATALDTWLQQWHACVREHGRPFAERRAAMHAVNPWFVLRNYVAQQAIDAATAGDFTVVRTLLDVLRDPYTEQPPHRQYALRRPEWAKHKAGCSMLSCSS